MSQKIEHGLAGRTGKSRRKQASPPREYRLTARFTPTGPDLVERIIFWAFVAEADADLISRERKAWNKTRAELLKLLPGTGRVRRARPVTDPVLRASSQAGRAVEQLVQAGLKGDAPALEALVKLMIHAAFGLTAMERMHPEKTRALARRQMLWPALIDGKPGSEERAAKRLARLELGADFAPPRLSFRKARGPDETKPARVWARAAVATIEESRTRLLVIGGLYPRFVSTEERVEFELKAGWESADLPRWIKGAAKLPQFSRCALAEWKPVVRALIREEGGAFENAPEWSNQRGAAQASGRNTPGEIRNAILDDILSALERLAPDNVPKSGC